MPTPFQPDNTWGLWAILVSWVAISIWLEHTYRWVAKISGPIVVMLGAVLLSNLHFIPTRSPVYDTVWTYVVPVCIPLLLFRASIVTIVRQSGPLFVVFHFSAIGTILGAIFAAFALHGLVPHAAELAGIMTGSYIGGSVNFVALTSIFDPEKRWTETVNSLIVADNLVMAVAFLVCFTLTEIPCLRRRFSTPHEDAVEREAEAGRDARSPLTDGVGAHVKSNIGEGAAAASVAPLPAAAYWRPKPISLLDIAVSLALAISVAAASNILGDACQKTALPGWAKSLLGQPYLILTTISIVLATAFHPWLKRVAGAEELGMYLIYLFFFVVGVPADVLTIFQKTPVLFAFCGIMAAFNLFVTLALTWLFRRNLEEAALSSNASLGGAPSAGAMAIAKGWRPLILPAILVGIWGYVIGTYLGLAVGRGLLWMLGG